jgi:predicted nucleotidyltransferase
VSAVEVPQELSSYLEELVRRLSAAAALDAVYLYGSAAQGAYEHGRSDVDVIAVTPRPSSRAEKEALAEAAESLPCPARKLELVVYARGAERHELNVNTGELVHFDAADDRGFWFVIDRAVAEQHSIALLGPPWQEVFAPVQREAVLEALDEAVAFDGWDDPRGAELAAARARIWCQTGTWVSKAEAAMRA